MAHRAAELPSAACAIEEALADLPEFIKMCLGYPTLRQAIWSMDLPSGRCCGTATG